MLAGAARTHHRRSGMAHLTQRATHRPGRRGKGAGSVAQRATHRTHRQRTRTRQPTATLLERRQLAAKLGNRGVWRVTQA